MTMHTAQARFAKLRKIVNTMPIENKLKDSEFKNGNGNYTKSVIEQFFGASLAKKKARGCSASKQHRNRFNLILSVACSVRTCKSRVC